MNSRDLRSGWSTPFQPITLHRYPANNAKLVLKAASALWRGKRAAAATVKTCALDLGHSTNGVKLAACAHHTHWSCPAACANAHVAPGLQTSTKQCTATSQVANGGSSKTVQQHAAEVGSRCTRPGSQSHKTAKLDAEQAQTARAACLRPWPQPHGLLDAARCSVARRRGVDPHLPQRGAARSQARHRQQQLS